MSDAVTTTGGASAPPAPEPWGIRLLDRIIDAGAAVAATLLIVVMLATTIKVLYRYGLHRSLIGVDQLSGMMLLYIAFLGAAWVLRRDEHIIIDLLLGHVQPRTRWLLLLASSVIGAATCLVVAGFGVHEVIGSIQRGVRTPSEIELPRAANLIVIPIGFLLMGLQFVRRTVASLRHGPAATAQPSLVSSV